MLESTAFALPRFDFFFETFDRKLQQYIEADLVSFSTRNFHENSNPKKFEVHQEPFAVLTLSELEAGFVVCIVPLAFSILVFAFEWIEVLKNLIITQFIFIHYFEAKKYE